MSLPSSIALSISVSRGLRALTERPGQPALDSRHEHRARRRCNTPASRSSDANRHLRALAYVVGVGLHEHFGHALACVALGSHPTELGATTSIATIRASAACASGWWSWPGRCILTGVVCLQLLRRLPRLPAAGFYFLWLLGALGLMDAAGYALFSGASGQGDLGTTSDGALQGATPEWLWRIGLFLVGAVT